MLDKALRHSFGWSALRTKTRMTMSTLSGSKSAGKVSEERSQTAALMVPTGGDKYSGLCCGMVSRYECVYHTQEEIIYLDELDSVGGVVVGTQVQQWILVGRQQREDGIACTCWDIRHVEYVIWAGLTAANFCNGQRTSLVCLFNKLRGHAGVCIIVLPVCSLRLALEILSGAWKGDRSVGVFHQRTTWPIPLAVAEEIVSVHLVEVIPAYFRQLW